MLTFMCVERRTGLRKTDGKGEKGKDKYGTNTIPEDLAGERSREEIKPATITVRERGRNAGSMLQHIQYMYLTPEIGELLLHLCQQKLVLDLSPAVVVAAVATAALALVIGVAVAVAAAVAEAGAVAFAARSLTLSLGDLRLADVRIQRHFAELPLRPSRLARLVVAEGRQVLGVEVERRMKTVEDRLSGNFRQVGSGGGDVFQHCTCRYPRVRPFGMRMQGTKSIRFKSEST